MSAMANSPAMPGPRRPVAGHTARVAWTAVGLVLAIVAVTVAVHREIRIEFQNSYALIAVHQRSYPDPVRHLVIRVSNGTVTVERATGSTTIVDTTGIRASRTPTDDEHLVGSTLYLRSSCGAGFESYCSRDYRVRVPGDVSLVVTDPAGNLLVSGMHGSVKATIGTGNVSVSDEVGPLKVSARSGSIVARHVDGSVDAITGTGDVLLADARGPVSVQSSNGNMAISNASTSVHVTAGTGSVVATGLAGSAFSATVQNGNIGLSFTTAPHDVAATTRTGSVTVRVPFNDIRYQLHLKTDTGRVVSGIPNDPSSTRVIRELTANGDVVLGVGAVPTTPISPTPPGTPVTPGSAGG